MFSNPPGPHSATALGSLLLADSTCIVVGFVGVNCSSYFMRDFPPRESEWLCRFSSVYFFASSNFVLGLITCERCMHSVTSKNHVALEERTVWVWYGQTTTFIPSAAVATRKATALHQNPRRVCARIKKQRPDLWGPQGKCWSFWLEQHDCDKKREVEENECGSCSVGVLTTRSDARLDRQVRSNFAKNHRGIILSIPLRRRRRWVCLLFFLHKAALPAIPCYCRLPLTIFTARRYSVCCFTGMAFPSLCSMFNPHRMYLFTLLTWLMVFSMITESFSHLSVPALQFYFCVSVDEHLIPVSFVFFPGDPRNLRKHLLFGDWVGDSFPGASSDMVVHHCPLCLIFWCAMALASSDMFDNSKLYEWSNDLGALLTLLLKHSSLERLSIRQASFHTCKKMFLIGFFWCNTDIGHRLRCNYFLSYSQLRLRFLSPFKFLVLRYAIRLPSADSGRVDFFVFFFHSSLPYPKARRVKKVHCFSSFACSKISWHKSSRFYWIFRI